MTYGKMALGKIFVSHSSVDKRKVRQLDKRLREDGYETWLDERELEVGDALAAKISEGVRDAKVVIIVVSAASLDSKWLRYELDIATNRMIDGHCRVIPVLIDDVEVPPELDGMLYADMRPGKKNGFSKIQKALASEAEKYPKPAGPPSMNSLLGWLRKQAYEEFLGDLSDGGWFFGTADVSATRSVDVKGFTLHGTDVHVDVVLDYGYSYSSISRSDFDDWSNSVGEYGFARFGLLVSERPLNPDLASDLEVNDCVGVQRGVNAGPVDLLVVADLSTSQDESESRDVLSRAHALIAHAVAAEQSDAKS
jgi:TIR domain